MSPRLVRFCHWVYRGRFVIALVPALACLWLASHARELQTDSSNRLLFPPHSEAYKNYESFRERYGSEETIVVGIRMPGGLSAERAAWIGELTAKLAAIDGIEGVQSLATAKTLEPGWFGPPVEKPLLEKLIQAKETPDDFLAEARRGPPEAQRLLSRDGRLAAIVLHVGFKEGEHDKRDGAIQAVKDAVSRSARPDASFLLSGTAVEQNAFVSQIEHDRRTFVPVAVAVIVTLLLIFQQSWRSLAYNLCVMAATLTASEGLMALTGVPLHAVTSLLSPLILIVAVSSTVNVYGRIVQAPPNRDHGEQLAAVLRGVFLPSFLATATTIIGFASLTFSGVPAIRQFGWIGAAAAFIAWCLAILWSPVVLGFIRAERPLPARLFEKAGVSLSGAMVRMRWAVSILAGVLVTAALLSAQDVRASTDLLKIFPAGDRFRKDTEALQGALGGIYPVEMRLPVPVGVNLNSADLWNRIQKLEEAISLLPNVSHTLAADDAIRYAERALKLTRDDRNITRILEKLPPEFENRFYTKDNGRIAELRLTVFLDTSDTARVVELVPQMRKLVSENLPGWQSEITGQTVLLAETSQELVRDELRSVCAAFAIILVLATLALASVVYALTSVIPSILPVTALFGLMKALEIPLNTSTAMIASVSLGLIFDNVIYLVCRYRENRAAGQSAYRSVCIMSKRGAYAVIGSSAILMGGFAVTMLGSMTPTIQFGLLSCAVAGISLANNLLVLPALLAILKPR